MNQTGAAASTPANQTLTILLAAPRGFCAGVDRAIQIVETALTRFGAPVYVRHEIVHNRNVVEALRAKGAVFVEELTEIPETAQPVIFSAHGVAKSVVAEARARGFMVLDATCPLVLKVHHEAQAHHNQGRQIALIGHSGHPEVVGTIGQLPEGTVTLIETVGEAEQFVPRNAYQLAYVTQTTLSVDDTAEIVATLQRRFPAIVGPAKEDICYATTNRQAAVKAIAPKVDLLIVVGAPNSSNSRRLVEVGLRAGCPKARLLQQASELPWHEIRGGMRVGLTAGASAPEHLVEAVIEACRQRFDVKLETVTTAEERIVFNIPRILRERPAI